MSDKNIDIIDILIVLAKRKKFIIITTVIVTAAVIIYSLMATKYWKSAVSFLTISQPSVPSAMVPQSLMGGMGASMLGLEPAGDALSFLKIIHSRTFSENIIRKYDLTKYFKIEDPDTLVVMEQAVKQLHEEMVNVDLDPETGMIVVAIESRDRYLSSDIANSYFQLLEEYFLETKMSKGRERRLFLEQRVSDFEKSFAELSKEVEVFQEEHNIVDIEAQTEHIVGLYAELAARKLEAEIELEYNMKFARENAHHIKALQERITVLNNKIRGMETGENDNIPTYIVNINNIPSLNSRYMQLNLNLEIQRNVIEFLYPQYERAKLDELSDISTFELVDMAIPSGQRSKPERAKMVIIGFVVSFFLSSLIAYTFESFTSSQRKDKIQELLRLIFKK